MFYEFDVDVKKWIDFVIVCDGLLFDCFDLKGKGDDYNVFELYLYGNIKNEGL